jgi:small nuclear ribonucleoprotein (snRNP)-like protein
MALDPNILNSLSKQVPRIARPQIEKRFRAAFQKVKNEMIAEFLNHPVTIEIKGGIGAKNLSGTLDGITNLFSFIGFDSSSDPTSQIENMLYKTNFKFDRYTNKEIIYSVYIPDAKEIFEVTPIPWATGRSWAKGIETGISGLGYYLKVDRDNSRSGLGIQSPRKVRKKGVKFNNISYISALIKKYKKKFENLEI